MTDRQKDLKDMYDGTKGNSSRFYYVKLTELERLGITQYKPIIGDNAIRIVFPPDRSGKFGKVIFRHTNIGAGKSTFLCLKEMFNKPCPVCELAEELRKRDPTDKRTQELGAEKRYLFFVFDVLNESTERKGLRWFDCPKSIVKEVMAQSRQRKRSPEDTEKYIDVSSPIHGRDIEFEQTKSKGRYEYVGVKLVDNNPIPEEWYKDVPEFDEILVIPTYEEVKAAVGDHFSTSTGNETESEVVEDTEEGTEVEESSKKETSSVQETTRVVPTRKTARRVEPETDDTELSEKVRLRTEQVKKERLAKEGGTSVE